MSVTVGGRDDYDALTLRGLARTSEDLRQARRLLSLACVHDGMSRADAAKGVGGTGCTMTELAEIIEPGPCLEHDGAAAGDDLTCNGGAKTGSVLSLTRGHSQAACSARLFPPHRAPATSGPELGPRPGPHGGFQKTVPQSLASPLNHGPADKPIEVWVQDEARIGQKTGRGRIRARKGTRPRGQADQRYKSACLSGAVCADRETGAALMLPCCHAAMGADTGTRNLPLKEISRPVAKGAQAAVLMARAPGHTSGEVKRGEGAGDPAPDLPASQITGPQSGREGLAISSGERALQPPP